MKTTLLSPALRGLHAESLSGGCVPDVMRKKHRGKQIDFFFFSFFFAGRPNYRAGINNYWRRDKHATVMHCNWPREVYASFFCLTCSRGELGSRRGSLVTHMCGCVLLWHVQTLLQPPPGSLAFLHLVRSFCELRYVFILCLQGQRRRRSLQH